MRAMRILPLVTLFVGASAYAQQIVTVGVPTDQFNYVASLQEQSEWCWAASTQMILRWLDVDVDQRDVVRRIRGDAEEQTASARDITRALNAISKSRSGKREIIHAMSAAGPPNETVMISELRQRVPMLLTIDLGPGFRHAVVLTAARYYRDAAGIHIVSLVIRDPYPTPDNIRNDGRMEISGRGLRAFVDCISRTWMVWVTEAKSTTVATAKALH